MTLETLTTRGMIEQISNFEDLEALLSKESISIYIGFDPTAKSLHVGHLLPVIVLSYLQKLGHQPIILVGGGTGMIGDPSGRNSERQFLSIEDVAENTNSIKKQLEKFFDFSGTNKAIIVNNYDWLSQIRLIEWLRDVGKYFSINYMLSKESVKRRLEERENGLSYTEFSYMLLQSFDFLYLHDHYNCKIQGGGNDQWGNITAGIDLIRKLRQEEAYGITFPLLTTSSGEKFGKSAGNAIWLDENLTTPYNFYQYWYNTDDRDVEKLYKLFTDLDLEEINFIISSHVQNPELRIAQKKLAEIITHRVHDKPGLDIAVRASDILFGKVIDDISEKDLLSIFNDIPSYELSFDKIKNGHPLIEFLVSSKICSSRGESRKLIMGGGVYINNVKVLDHNYPLTKDNLIANNYIVLRIGKKQFYLIKLI